MDKNFIITSANKYSYDVYSVFMEKIDARRHSSDTQYT